MENESPYSPQDDIHPVLTSTTNVNSDILDIITPYLITKPVTDDSREVQ